MDRAPPESWRGLNSLGGSVAPAPGSPRQVGLPVGRTPSRAVLPNFYASRVIGEGPSVEKWLEVTELSRPERPVLFPRHRGGSQRLGPHRVLGPHPPIPLAA